jgi:hypothetical protein
MEHHAERPAREVHVAEPQVVFAQRVICGYLVAQLVHTPVVGEVVEEREDDAEGLLHAHEAVEGPFAVELVHGLGRGAREGDDVLTRVVAFGGAGPEEETAVESCGMICKSNILFERMCMRRENIRMGVGASPMQLAAEQTCRQSLNSWDRSPMDACAKLLSKQRAARAGHAEAERILIVAAGGGGCVCPCGVCVRCGSESSSDRQGCRRLATNRCGATRGPF